MRAEFMIEIKTQKRHSILFLQMLRHILGFGFSRLECTLLLAIRDFSPRVNFPPVYSVVNEFAQIHLRSRVWTQIERALLTPPFNYAPPNQAARDELAQEACGRRVI
jgi:hypothetical protein